MPTLSELLTQHACLIADGAWGTELAKQGLGPGEAPDAWNLSHPHLVRGIARSYVMAGAQIILTNTFGGTTLKLQRAGLADDAFLLNRAGARLSREAADEGTLVFGSLGPTGEFMRPLGLITEEEMQASFGAQVQALVEGGVDGFVIETMSDLGEALAALRAVREHSALPAVVSLTFAHGPGGYATIMGVKPERAARELTAAGADVVGANCGAGMDLIVGAIGEMAGHTSLPLWAKPNAGLPVLEDGCTVFRETPEQMAAQAPALRAAGARIIGGCCGSTPAHVRALAAALQGD
jgi:5-methyltetrahydrofolate--homocysteine methyltransferase